MHGGIGREKSGLPDDRPRGGAGVIGVTLEPPSQTLPEGQWSGELA